MRQTPAASDSADDHVPRGETEIVADRLPQTEVLDTQMVGEVDDDVPPPETTAAAAQLPSPPAAEPQQAPDELMLEAQELLQPPTMHFAGHGDGATLLLHSMPSFDERVELATAQAATPAEPTAEGGMAAMASNMRVPSLPSEPAFGVATLGAAPQVPAPDQAEALQPSATLSQLGVASPMLPTALVRPSDFAAASGASLRSSDQLAATSAPVPLPAPAPLPVQPPPSGPAQRPARIEERVEPAAASCAEPELLGMAANAPRSLEEVRAFLRPQTGRAAAALTQVRLLNKLARPQMSAQLKKLMSEVRSQQVRTQVLMNDIVMLASPIHHHKMAELQKKGACAWERWPFLTLRHIEFLSWLLTLPLSASQLKRSTRRLLPWSRGLSHSRRAASCAAPCTRHAWIARWLLDRFRG